MTETFQTQTQGTQSIKQESYFDGGLLEIIGLTIVGNIISLITFGLAVPWALCLVYGWQINHTVVEGKRLHFHGSALSLFGNWLKWLFLIVITLGIYGFWVGIALEEWKAKNTRFA